MYKLLVIAGLHALLLITLGTAATRPIHAVTKAVSISSYNELENTIMLVLSNTNTNSIRVIALRIGTLRVIRDLTGPANTVIGPGQTTGANSTYSYSNLSAAQSDRLR